MHGTAQYQQSTGGRGGLRFRTRNYLDEDVRKATCQRLNQILADIGDLRMAAKYAHWNVKGMNFFPLHELFEEIAETLAEHEDLVAERITALGGQAKGTVRQAAANSRIAEMPADTTMGRGFVRELATRLAAYDANLYEDIRATEEYGDLDTTDLLNEISRDATHYLWFLEAHLQGRPEGQVWGGGQQQWLSGDAQ